MKITLLTYGSQGDVEPFSALARGLVKAGHQVCLAAPKKFEFLINKDLIKFAAFPGDPQELVQDLVEQAGRSWWRMVRSMSGFVLPLGLEVSQIARKASQDADLIVHSFLLTNSGYEIARENGIPDISAQTFPVFTSTSDFPSPAAPDLPLGGLYRRLTHKFVTLTFWQGSRIIYSSLRKKNHDLPPLTCWPFNPHNQWQTPILYAFSPQIIPRPTDWRKDVHLTGYWFSTDDSSWKPDDRLGEFLKKGAAPIAVVFGSTSTRKLTGIYHKVFEALRITNQRGIIVGQKPEGLDSAKVYWQEGFIPYGWLFKHSAAVIHHGGAGTTGKALRAGIPGIILPFTSDQPFWGRRVHQLGVGPKPLNPKRMTSRDVANAIHWIVNDPEIKSRAEDIGQRLMAEDGITQAVDLIQRYGRMKRTC